MSPIEQVAAQSVYTQKAVSDGMAVIPSNRKLEISYADFCADPSKIYSQIYEKYQSMGSGIPLEYNGNECFDECINVRLSRDDEGILKTAISHFERESILYLTE